MIRAYEFAPGRLVLESGERVRVDPNGALGVLLGDFDVLTEDESKSLLRLAGGHIFRQLARIESDYDEMAKRRSGPSGKPWTEKQYRDDGKVSLKLRLSPEDVAPLDELVKEWGLEGTDGRARGEAVRRAINQTWERVLKDRTPLPRHTMLTEQEPDESVVMTKEPQAKRPGARKSDKSE